MIVRFSILILCGFILLISTACSTTDTEFRILNRSPYELEVSYKGRMNMCRGSFILKPGMDKRIVSVEELIPLFSSEGNKKSQLIKSYFKRIEISSIQEGEISYQQDVLSDQKWIFDPNGYQDRRYVLIINTEDFGIASNASKVSRKG